MFTSVSLSSVSRFCHTHCRFTETFFFFFNVHLFLAILGLRCCASFSLVATSGSTVSLWCFSWWWPLLLQSTGSGAGRLHQLWLLGSGAQTQQLRHMGLVAPRHVGSSWTRACMSPVLPGGFFTTELPGKPILKPFNL